MAKKKQEDAGAPGAPAWMATFSDLMNLLLCFFVLLFSMSSVDANKWEQVVASMQSSFSIFSGGASSIGDGLMVSMGTSQLSNLDEYYSQMGQKDTESENESYVEEKTEGGKAEGKPEGHSDGKDGGNGGDNNGEQNAGETAASEEGSRTDGGKDGETQGEDKNKSGEDQNNEGISDEELLAGLMAKENLKQTGAMLDEVSALSEDYFLSDYLEISMDSSGKYVEILVSGSVLFDSGKAEIKDDAIPVLSKLGDILGRFKDNQIDIIGHTDNVPIKSSKFESNDILSSARAISAAQYLSEKKGIPIESLSWTGRGEHDPVASNSTAEGRAKNRRIEIRIYNDLNSDN